jgi:hypothetical protein
MAKITGWEKIGVNRWRNKSMILDVHLANSNHHYLSIPAWNVTVTHYRSNTYFADEILPNKEQALQFAYAYMRRNP